MSDVTRSPSRIGFMRPPLKRQDNSFQLDWGRCEDYEDDEDEDEDERTFMGTLRSSSNQISDHGDDFGFADPPPLLRPSLPSDTISITINGFRGDTSVCVSIKDHGHSRSALSQLKEFWSSRRSEYMFSCVSSKRKPSQGSLKAESPSTPPSNGNAAIYPRTGDLKRLRDQRFTTIDRAFCNLPLHSINKMLFLHDMLDRSNTPPSSPSESRSTSPFSCARGSLDMDDSSSFVDVSLTSEGCSSESDTPSSEGDDGQSYASYLGKTPHTPPVDPREWEVNWTARWEVVLSATKAAIDSAGIPRRSTVDEGALLSTLDSLHKHPVPINPKKIALPRFTKPTFYIPEDEEDLADLGDSDDDDYGRIITCMNRGLSAEELSREYLNNDSGIPLLPSYDPDVPYFPQFVR
ncbi:hypothetical protein EW026_g6112 [Hermanssonia centrifuga]|uniref:Uncharacterized protein n=1 Tax=Hermanssonia centrifuga TaxID=98765 RepID=A0A4S4KDR0_9APHY|nr:hypothetical protein EW026_g6112 [Hermanssonia centrifuga]